MGRGEHRCYGKGRAEALPKGRAQAFSEGERAGVAGVGERRRYRRGRAGVTGEGGAEPLPDEGGTMATCGGSGGGCGGARECGVGGGGGSGLRIYQDHCRTTPSCNNAGICTHTSAVDEVTALGKVRQTQVAGEGSRHVCVIF